MGYLKCEDCGRYYELRKDESLDDFEKACECGGKLFFIENLDDYFEKNILTCSNCGTDNTKEARFCQECGAKLKNNSIPSEFIDTNKFFTRNEIIMEIKGEYNQLRPYEAYLKYNNVIFGRGHIVNSGIDYTTIKFEDIEKMVPEKTGKIYGNLIIKTKYSSFSVKGVRNINAERFAALYHRIMSGETNLENFNHLKTDEIPIYAGSVNLKYDKIGKILVRADSSLFSKTATMDDVNGRLREEAVKLGANAIINAKYERSSLTSWRGIKAEGIAVFIEPDEKKCPFCAEIIKKEAIRCKHCGSDLN